MTEARDAFKNRCTNAARTLSACVGYTISRISFDAFAEEDSLEITLREGPWKPDVVISLSNLHHVSVDKPPQIARSFIDEISLIHLPVLPHPWPADTAARVRRFDGLCELHRNERRPGLNGSKSPEMTAAASLDPAPHDRTAR